MTNSITEENSCNPFNSYQYNTHPPVLTVHIQVLALDRKKIWLHESNSFNDLLINNNKYL